MVLDSHESTRNATSIASRRARASARRAPRNFSPSDMSGEQQQEAELSVVEEATEEPSNQQSESLIAKKARSKATPLVLGILGAAFVLAIVVNSVKSPPDDGLVRLDEPCGSSMSTPVPSPDDAPLIIYYWPVMARAAALFRMCDAVGYPYQHISAREELARMVSSNRVHGPGGEADMFAPPGGPRPRAHLVSAGLAHHPSTSILHRFLTSTCVASAQW